MHCDREPLGGSCFGETVFIPKTEDPLLYDGKLIHMKHPTVIKVLKIGQDHATYHIPVFIDKDRNDTANLNWYGHVRRGVSPLRQLNQGTHSGIVS